MTLRTDPAFASVSLAVHADGKILVGGDFSTLGGQTRNNLGRLNAALSGASDHVALVVAGRILDLSGCPVVAE